MLSLPEIYFDFHTEELKFEFEIFSFFSDAEEELNKLAELAERINSQISTEETATFNTSQNVDLDQLFNFLSQVG